MDPDGRVKAPRFGKTVDSNSRFSIRGSSATSTTLNSSDAGDLNLEVLRLNREPWLHPPRARGLSDVRNKHTISRDNTSGAELRKADLFEYIGRKTCKLSLDEECSGAVDSSSSPKWEDLPQNVPQNAQQLMQARFIQQQQDRMRQKMQNAQQPGMQMGRQRMIEANIGVPNGELHVTREEGQQVQLGLEQRIAMQTQEQISILSTKLFQENLLNWLQQQQLTQETCPPDLLQNFKMQCLSSARQKVLQLRQQQQQQQALAVQQKQHIRGHIE